MKISLYSRPQMEHAPSDVLELVTALDRSGLSFAVNEEFAEAVERITGKTIPAESRYDSFAEGMKDALVVVSYGGDGTFLECVRLMEGSEIPILGINSGRLGFLANVPKEGMAQAFEDLKAGLYTKEPRTLLYVEGDFQASPIYPYAFNEFSIQRDSNSMISIETYVNDEMVAKYWSDGVLLSTPAGSTAYSLSVGGPVLAPECECFVISPIAPHNLTMRPVVIPDDSKVSFRVNSRGEKVYITLDNASFLVGDGSVFKVSKSIKSVFLVRLQNISFYDTLRNKMLWGIDRRDDKKE